MVMPNMSLRIDEIERRPILVVKGPPYEMVVVDGDRIIDCQILRGAAYVVQVFLKRELR